MPYRLADDRRFLFLYGKSLPVMPGLDFEQAGIYSVLFDQFFMRSRLGDPSVRKHINAVRHADGGKTMTDEDDGAAPGQFPQIFKNRSFSFGIHGARRLIENDDLRVAQ